MASLFLASASLSRVQTAAGPVELAEVGQGLPVLAIHGGMGGYDQGLLLAEAVLGADAGFRILAPSRPGYLGTPELGRRTPQDHARLYAALLDAQGIDKVLAIGVSAAGPSALAFALSYPERCLGLVLVSAVTGPLDIPPDAARRLPFIRMVARVPLLSALFSVLARMRPHRAAARSILDPSVRDATMAHPEAGPLMRALQESVASRISERLDATLRDVACFNAMPPLPVAALQMPLLAVHGTGDRVVPVSHLHRVGDALPTARLLRLEEAEHVCLVTHLETVRGATLAFADACRDVAPINA